jgi:hypothetical protein
MNCVRCGLPIEGEGTTAKHLPGARVHEDCPTGAYPKFNLQTVSAWMREQLRMCPDLYAPDGLGHQISQLAENAAVAFKVNQLPGGPLDDSEHWIWTAATGAIAWWEKQPKLKVVK